MKHSFSNSCQWENLHWQVQKARSTLVERGHSIPVGKGYRFLKSN
jgi:hypothetical protein